jgi:hypothetical protein
LKIKKLISCKPLERVGREATDLNVGVGDKVAFNLSYIISQVASLTLMSFFSVLNKHHIFLRLFILFLLCALNLIPFTSDSLAATVAFVWDKNSESDLAGYRVHYGSLSGNYDYSVDVGNYTSCTISGLEEGETYYFAATAYDEANNESNFSEELTLTIPVGDTGGGGSGDTDITVIEAEDGYLNAPLEVFQDSSASGNNYIEAPNGSGSIYDDPNQVNSSAEYSFIAPVTGNYVIWGRVKAMNGDEDSFFISVDGGDYALWDLQISQDWVWDKVNDRAGADPVIFYLEAGQHTLMLKHREDGSKIDQILITGDLEFVPE